MEDNIRNEVIAKYSSLIMQDMLLQFYSSIKQIVTTPLSSLYPKLVETLDTALGKRKLCDDTDLFIWASQCADRAIVRTEDPLTTEAYVQVESDTTPEKERLVRYRWDYTAFCKRIYQVISCSIVPDAERAVSEINTAIDDIVLKTADGFKVVSFDWGVLSDPLTTNAVMTYGQRELNIFEDGVPVIAYYSEIALRHAESLSGMLTIDDDVREKYFNYLKSHGDIEPEAQALIEKYYFSTGNLSDLIIFFSDTRKNPKELVALIGKMSELFNISVVLRDILIHNSEDVPAGLKELVERVFGVVMSFFAAIVVLRETVYSETLFMWVGKVDGICEAIINADLLEALRTINAAPNQLGIAAQYIADEEEIAVPEFGRSLEWYKNAREHIETYVGERKEELEKELSVKAKQLSVAVTKDILNRYVAQYLRLVHGDDSSGSLEAAISNIADRVTTDTILGSVVCLFADALKNNDLSQLVANIHKLATEYEGNNEGSVIDVALSDMFISHMIEDFTEPKNTPQ